MKKLLSTLLAVICFGSVSAQVPANATVYDCNGVSKNIYTTLASGKSVIVAHKGVDCSICRNSAPAWQTWAAANTNKVEVWGAITYSFSSSAFPTANMCTLTNNWKATYGWNDIFTFPDSNRSWYQGSSPRYFVYSAIDSSIVYQGSNATIARNSALAQSTVGIEINLLESAKVFVANGNLNLKNIPQDIDFMSIYSASGQLVLEQRISEMNSTTDVTNYEKGVYIIRFSNEKGIESRKLIF